MVKDGKIAEVTPKPTARCGTTIDGAGKTLLPGLIDAHTQAHREADLASALRYGVTTELDMYGAPKVKATIRALAHQRTDVADVYFAGYGVTSSKGHGTEYGMPVRTVDRPSGAEAFVDACVSEGSDYIKIIYTPNSPLFQSISRETLQASVDAAHRRNLLTLVHIDKLGAATEALEVGADGLAHLFWNHRCKGVHDARLQERHEHHVRHSRCRKLCLRCHGRRSEDHLQGDASSRCITAPPPCDRDGLQLIVSRSALAVDQHSLAGLELTTTTAKSITVRASRDGQVIGESTRVPEYRTGPPPNGPDCPPDGCTSATYAFP